MRTCVGCRQTAERDELLRVVVSDEGDVVVDLAATAFGRGAWVHARPECIRSAATGLGRTLRVPVRTGVDALFAVLRSAADRRLAALLSAARASGKLAIGTDAVQEALRAGRAEAVLVAEDARASATTLPASAAGRISVWGKKADLGAALGRGETGVVAVVDPGLARAIRRAVALSTLSPEASSPSGSSHAFVEVR